MAALREGFSAILIEREDEYRADIALRMGLVKAGPSARKAAAARAKQARRGGADDHGPLFGGGHEGVNRSIYGEFADERGKRSGRTIGRAGSKGRPA